MIRLLVDPLDPESALVMQAADVLRAGGVIAYPTDTLYALAVDPRSDAAVGKLCELKGRDSGAPIALVAADTRQAAEAGVFGEPEERLAEVFWPGPLTIVVPAATAMSRRLSGVAGTLGVRVPAHAVARALAGAAGTCITATSANLSGRSPAVTADEVAARLAHAVDVLLDGGPAPGGPPSSVVQVIAGVPTLHRAGAVAWDRVLESLR